MPRVQHSDVQRIHTSVGRPRSTPTGAGVRMVWVVAMMVLEQMAPAVYPEVLAWSQGISWMHVQVKSTVENSLS
jgi:hypothetical protein